MGSAVRGEFGAAGVDGQHGEALRHVVVQFAGEQRTFLFLGPDQALTQAAQLALGSLPIRHVRSTPNVRVARPAGSRSAAPAA